MEEDRISKLPDAIIQHILSSVNLKQAAQTSVLSKRWTRLWSSLTTLDFDFCKLVTNRCANMMASLREEKEFMSRFERFVIQYLSLRDHASPITKFQLTAVDVSTDSSFIQKCLDLAISQGVQHLDIDTFCYPMPLEFPDSLLACKTIRVLRLKQYITRIVVPKPFILPNLTTLYLDSFNFKDGDENPNSFPKEPFSRFPNLEMLTLRRCDVSGLIIRSSNLRFLEIRYPLFAHKQGIEQISTPRLVSFKHIGCVYSVCPDMDLRSLEEVYLDAFRTFETPYTDDVKKKMSLNLVTMLRKLGNSKFVTLTFHTLEVLAMDHNLLEQSPSPFPNIKCLKLIERGYENYPRNMHLTQDDVPQTVMNYLTKGSHLYNSR